MGKELMTTCAAFLAYGLGTAAVTLRFDGMTGAISDQQREWAGPMFFNTDGSRTKYIIQMGAISLLPSMIIAGALYGLGAISETTSPSFPPLRAPVLLAAVVVIGPAVETLFMSLILWFLSLFVKGRIFLAILSAVIWALLHSLDTPVWGLGVIWPFFVFSCAYLAWRDVSWRDAFVVTWGIHAFQNVIPGLAIASQYGT
jgi:hypothetical protein